MNSKRGRKRTGFTLIEVLMVIAIISIMAALVINTFSNAAQDSREVIARQQQAVVQSALNNFVSQQLTGSGTISSVQSAYNGLANGQARLTLIQAYLDEKTYAHFIEHTTNVNQVKSDAMSRVGKYLKLDPWANGSYPKVELLP